MKNCLNTENVQLVYGGGSCCDYAKAVSVSAHCEDYEARSNIMWTATWALNTLVANEGLNAMEAWMKELVLAMNISELGTTEPERYQLRKQTIKDGGDHGI